MAARSNVWIWILLLTAGCGAKIVGDPRADGGREGGVGDTGAADASACGDCDDGVACTRDACGDDGTCTHTANDGACVDDGVSCTTARCDATAGCVVETNDALCDDDVACTPDACDTARGCVHTSDEAACSDGVACTRDRCAGSAGCLNVPDDALCSGAQICRSDTGCFDSPRCSGPGDPRCDDLQPCTTDTCDPATGRCSYASDDAMCADGAFCNGNEVCAAFVGCLIASVPSCTDGIACTTDQCNEAMDRCDSLPQDRLCNDADYCNGVERCNVAAGGCQAGTAPSCDDGVACTTDACDAAGGCTHTPDDAACSDGVACTRDRCGGSAGCLNVPDDSLCSGAQTCRSDTGCFDPPRCSGPGDPRCDDLQPCTTDTCDAATGRCSYATDDTMCTDGAFCNGAEVCVPFFGCLLESVPNCTDGIACTIDQCNEAMDRCDSLPEDRLCSDGAFCNGVERCDAAAGGCRAGTVPSCDDASACTTDVCNESLDRCDHPVRDGDGDGDGTATCGGRDCDDTNPAVSSLAAETCNAIDDDCDGTADDGVLGPCGDCDPSCRRTLRAGAEFTGGDRIGAEVDPGRGGLVISAVTRVNNFLWVPNTAESTFSKWDATTATELARYRVGLPAGECPGSCCWTGGCNMPSRVAVDGRGDAYVANRGFSMQGTVTKIAADIADCVDRNGNGRIDTSTDATPLAWGADECILWNVPVGMPDAVLRAFGIDRGDTSFPEGYPWVGGYNSQLVYKLNPRTGAVLYEVSVAPVRPYGLLGTADGRIWVTSLDTGNLAFLDATLAAPTPTVIAYPLAMRSGCNNGYGVTADASGRLWISGWGCNDALGYDPRSGSWTRVDTTVYGMTAGRGITVDGMGRIWMALGGDGASNVVRWNADAFLPGGTISGPAALTRMTLPAGHTGPSGIGADRDGNIWVAHQITSQLVKIDPRTGTMTSYSGPNRVYTYSDFTGSVRRTVIGTGSFTENIDAGCAAPDWARLDYDVVTPAGTRVTFTMRTAADAASLDAATAVQIAQSPPDTTPGDVRAALMGASITPARWLRLSTTLEGAAGTSPVVRGYTATWYCP